MKGDGGFFFVWRQLWDNPNSKDPNWVALFMYMLHRATYTKGLRERFGGFTFELQPGQFISSAREMAEDTGIHQSKVERLLKQMKIDEQIDKQVTNLNTLYIITNWSKYQKRDEPKNEPATSQ